MEEKILKNSNAIMRDYDPNNRKIKYSRKAWRKVRRKRFIKRAVRKTIQIAMWIVIIAIAGILLGTLESIIYNLF